MSRPISFNTEEECIHHYVGRYYEEYAKDPTIRFKPEDHIEMADGINEGYLKDMARNKKFDYEKYAGAFIECIDFLTKIYTNKGEKEASSDRKKQLLLKFSK